MTLKDLLKKRDKIRQDVTPTHVSVSPKAQAAPEFTFMRTTTSTQEVISPPSFDGDSDPISPSTKQNKRSSFSRLRSSSNASTASYDQTPHSEKRLSARLHLRSRTSSSSSVHVPTDLPTINDAAGEEKEAQWEKRATILANTNKRLSQEGPTEKNLQRPGSSGDRPAAGRNISSAQGDVKNHKNAMGATG